MSENNEKDFLSQFSSENKPKSFAEEERIPVNNSFQPNWKVIGIAAAVVLLLAGLVYFLFLRPKIEMPNFVGKTQSDVAAWVRQQEIDSTGIIMNREYSMDFDENQIISQSIEPGKKIRKDAKINFVLSQGADPDEKIKVPDIANMTKQEISDWVSKNKLQKVKVTTAYSDTVEDGNVISFEFKGVEPEDFTRGSTLNISVSKGPAPVGTVTVDDFIGKYQAEAESWSKSTKIALKVIEGFNSKPAGTIYAQSVEKGKTMKAGETLIIYVSKGEGFTVPNFTTMTKSQFETWQKANKDIYVDASESRYSKSTAYIVSQTPSAGSMVAKSEPIVVILNLGNTFYANDVGISLVGNTLEHLTDILNSLRSKGIDAYADNWTAGDAIYSDTYSRDQIISVQCTGYSDNRVYPCDGPLPLDARFDVVISKGKVTTVSPTGTVSSLMNELSGVVSFKLDPAITADMYDRAARITLADGTPVNDGKVYEDKEYRIVLN